MPKKTNDKTNLIEKDDVNVKPISKNSTKKVSDKKASEKIKTVTKKVATKTVAKKATTKNTESKTIAKKTSTKTSSKKPSSTKTKKSKKIEILEYYDLPYRYNETVVKILAQTPDTLFVYWDISDEDKQKYIEEYGEYFFNNTKPVLKVHNITLNYDFEVDINDFANSWYLHINDSKCDYNIEIGRRPINNYVSIPNNYLYISSSNEIESPNDHILFDKLGKIVYFRNVKSNVMTQKHISSISSIRRIGKLNNVYDFYKKMYENENFNFDRFDLKNPTSGNPTSTFK